MPGNRLPQPTTLLNLHILRPPRLTFLLRRTRRPRLLMPLLMRHRQLPLPLTRRRKLRRRLRPRLHTLCSSPQLNKITRRPADCSPTSRYRSKLRPSLCRRRRRLSMPLRRREKSITSKTALRGPRRQILAKTAPVPPG